VTPYRCFTARVFVIASLLIPTSVILRAQSNDARITGIITDPSKAVIPSAKVDLFNVDTGVRYPAVTNGSGIYSVSGQVGNYRIEVEHVGFKTVIAPGVVLHTQDVLEINFEMAVGSASESVTVNAGATNDNPAVSMTVDREFVENMPLNGRSLQDLIQLAPGTVSASGYYSINGQRTDSNNYTVDGVSANLGGYNNTSVSGGNYGAGLSGASPSQSALGTTQSLVSVDSLQEFKIQTSGYAAEYGRNPGGQAEFTTRSGTNDIHASVFEYLRNTAFDANTYANNFFDEPKTAEHQNDFGGTVGGPLIIPKLFNGRDRTFYFFSYEGLRLLLPHSESEYVPTQAFRQWASPYVQPYLNASPLPNPNSTGNQDGCTIPDLSTGNPTACDAHFYYGYSSPNNLDNISVRLDHNLGKHLHAFLRYADTPSSSIEGAESSYTSSINAHSWTAGATANITHTLLDDFRFNYSHDGEGAVYSQRPVGGSVPLPRNLLIPAAYDSAYSSGSFYVGVPGSALGISTSYGGTGSIQHQYQIVDTLSWIKGKHSLKFGADWRRLTPTYASQPYNSRVASESLANLQEGYATFVVTGAEAPGSPAFDNLSLYAQDHWKVNARLTLDYGLRWEFNPPPGPSNGHYPVTLTSSNLAVAQLAPAGTPPYKTTYNHFAPRFGFAWNAIPSLKHEVTIRGGFGIFFDTGQQLIGNAYTNTYPFSVSGSVQKQIPLPLSDAVLAPPSLNFPLTPPYQGIYAISSPDLTLPYAEQWNISLDEAVNPQNTLTVSYVGNNGRKLLFSQTYSSIPGNPDFVDGITFQDNGSQSSYNALQVVDTGRITHGLDIVTSFTLAHALDNQSNDFVDVAPIWANSDNDLRRVFNLAVNYQTPYAGRGRWAEALTRGWLLANRFATQSGYPLDVIQAYGYLPNGTEELDGPDLVPGVPIYLHGRAADFGGKPVPASWRLNPAAFAAVPTDPTTGIPIRQGTLGRNYVRNPSFWALNTALQRSFPIYERLHLNLRVEAFNIFNHPNPGNADNYLSDSTFGQLAYGMETTIGSSNQLYSMGASRSLQLSLRLEF
jgi:hypothetical protein